MGYNSDKNRKNFEKNALMVEKSEKSPIFAARKQRELSSVGSEHRPYKAGVVGSSPTVPTTKKPLIISGFFYFNKLGLLLQNNLLGLHAIVADHAKDIDSRAEVQLLVATAADGFAADDMS